MSKKPVRNSILRTTRIVHLLSKGKKMTTKEVAEKTGLTENGAWRLMDTIASSHEVSVTCIDGFWQMTEEIAPNATVK